MSVSNMANTVDMDDNERKIVTEFCHYLEKSKQLFNGLRSVMFVGGAWFRYIRYKHGWMDCKISVFLTLVEY